MLYGSKNSNLYEIFFSKLKTKKLKQSAKEKSAIFHL